MKGMKHLFNFLLLVICVVSFSACSSDDDNPTKTIEINSGTENQIVYADDTEGKDGISFTATEAWTATVAEKISMSRASEVSSSGVSWVRLLFNGTEKYSGSAGTFTLTIELDTNLTGTSRSATITIKSGKDSITINVTQEGVTEEGKEPEQPSTQKNISKVVYTSSNLPYAITTTILYGKNGIDSIHTVNYDGVGTIATYKYEYLGYIPPISGEPKKFIEINSRYKNSEPIETGTIGIILNNQGYAEDISLIYYNIEKSIIDENAFEFEYKDGFLSKVSGYDEINNGTEGGRDYDGNDYSICKWDENGNMIKIENVFYDKYSGNINKGEQFAKYSTYLNNFNLDINWIIEGIYIPGVSDSSVAMNIWGKKSKYLISQYETTGSAFGSEITTYKYTFESNLLIKVVATDTTGWVGTYKFTYQ